MSFQPFAVQCQTCGSRLRVTDSAIVGTIAACPKCNSMVQIDRPGGQVAVGQSDVDSQAITEEGIEVGSGSAVAAGQSNEGRGFAGSESVDSDETDLVAPADPMQWQSDRTRRSRQVALVVALSLSGLLSAVAVFSWFVHSWRQQRASATAEVPSTETPETADATQQPDSEQTPPGDVSAAVNDLVESTQPPDPPTQEPDLQTQDPDLPKKDPDPEDLATGASIPDDLIPRSPIAPSAESESTEPADAEIGNMRELPPGLAMYTPFLIEEGSTDVPTLKAPPTVDEIKIDAAAEDNVDPLIASKPTALNLNAALAIKLAFQLKTVDSKGYPLADLMLLVSQITGVPIQVDWVSFDLSGTDIDVRISPPKGWRSARETLQEVASGLGAEIRQEDSLLILTLSDATFSETMATIGNLDDFVGDSRASASTVLKEFLRRDEDPQPNQLQLGQTREQQQLAALAIESLRRMRGIEPKVADQRLRHWARSSENELVQWPLLTAGDAGPKVETPITIAEVLRRSARRNSATCVVNWLDANRQGVSPKQLVFLDVGVDAATTLEQTLRPLAMQVRKVDAEHWWVGSEATYDRLPVVVWTPPLGEARDTFTQRITTIMADASRDVFRLTIDEETDRALLLLPRYIAGQLPKITPAIAAK